MLVQQLDGSFRASKTGVCSPDLPWLSSNQRLADSILNQVIVRWRQQACGTRTSSFAMDGEVHICHSVDLKDL